MSRIFEALKIAERSVAAKVCATVTGDFERQASVQPCILNGINTPPFLGISEAAKASAEMPHDGSERRKQRRAGAKLAVRVRPADPEYGGFEEVLWTLNSSRAGLYCTTASAHYHPGMWVRITFPYHSAHDSLNSSEDSGELARVEPLRDKRFGLAVLLRGSAQAGTQAHTRTYASSRTIGERRLAVRQPFTSAAIVISAHAQMRLQARCADLSLNGCYLDSMNPYPVGTLVQLRLNKEEKTFAAVAGVRSSHPGMGMGLAFQELPPEQMLLIADWLNDELSGYYAGG
jgi:PilZ domain